jgi:CheY-specific phosphatase CheX
MNKIDPTVLTEITISALERTAMVLAEPAAEGQETPAPTRFASIAYRGPSEGTIVLSATEGFLQELAASLLGVEAGEVNIESHGNDALKEMANIVGGSVILAMSGDTCEYSLGLPALVKSADAPSGGGAPPVECTLVADGGVLSVRWCEERSAKAA